MSNTQNAIRGYFTMLGFGADMADMYISLHTYGPQGILQLSRTSGIERRKIYRLIDTLAAANLIEVDINYKRKTYRAAPIDNVQILLSRREEELQDLRQQLEQLEKLMVSTQDPVGARVQFYSGKEAIKQMLWNETKGHGENLGILYENVQGITKSLPFFTRWAEQCNANNITFRGIVSDHFVTTLQQWYTDHSPIHNTRLNSWQARYINPDVYPINHSTVTYDDVVAFYNWKGSEVFGIELHNKDIAAAQRRIFEILWTQAEPIDELKSKAHPPKPDH